MHLAFRFGAYFDKSSDVPALEMEEQRAIQRLSVSIKLRQSSGGVTGTISIYIHFKVTTSV